jgi:RND family efflux transporter MFP subunit
MNMLTPIESHDVTENVGRRRFDRLSRSRRAAIVLIPLALVAAAGAKLADRSPAVAASPPPPAVTVAEPLIRDVTEWDDYVGRFAPSRSVEIRPRIAGEVTAIHFRDGQIVQKGQLLVSIDSRPYSAALAEARASAASARSALVLARADLGRATRLIADEAVAPSEVDSLRAKVQAAQAALAAADARVRARALDVEFTQVRAPITGRISDRRVDAGNQVAGGEGTAGTVLTTINALDPIYFTFDSSEALYLKTQRARQPGAEAAVVEIRLQDETEHRWKGKLDFTDNGLDQRSGTIRGRAVLPNPDNFLTPGMFGNMRLASGGKAAAMLVPDTAIQTDQARKVVLTVDSQNQVTAKAVELGPVVNGLRIIRSGLAPHDKVIITGIQMATPGEKVTPQLGHIPANTQSAGQAVTVPLAGEATIAN